MFEKFNDFEIRPYKGFFDDVTPGKFEVVKWYKTEPHEVLDLKTGEKKVKDTFCFTVAFIEWNKREPCWEFRSVGIRFIEEYENGLCEYIKRFLKLAEFFRPEIQEEMS